MPRHLAGMLAAERKPAERSDTSGSHYACMQAASVSSRRCWGVRAPPDSRALPVHWALLRCPAGIRATDRQKRGCERTNARGCADGEARLSSFKYI